MSYYNLRSTRLCSLEAFQELLDAADMHDIKIGMCSAWCVGPSALLKYCSGAYVNVLNES